MKAKWIIKMILMGVLFFAFVIYAVMGLWNWLIPAIFTGPVITYWQAAGLLVLSRILFGSRGCKGGSQWGKWGGMKDRWQSMTPEEKSRMKELWRNRCRKWEKDQPAPTEPADSKA